jgi:hypothetical protein
VSTRFAGRSRPVIVTEPKKDKKYHPERALTTLISSSEDIFVISCPFPGSEEESASGDSDICSIKFDSNENKGARNAKFTSEDSSPNCEVWHLLLPVLRWSQDPIAMSNALIPEW